MFDITGFIISYETGEATAKETLEGFAHLIKTGMAFGLQESDGRAAMNLIDNGIIDREGNIDWARAGISA